MSSPKGWRVVRKKDDGRYMAVAYDHPVDGEEEVARDLGAWDALAMEHELERAREVLES